MGPLKKLLSVLLILCLLAGLLPMAATPARALAQKLDTDAYANQWGRSDLRAWLNGLAKDEDGSLPVDGSGGVKGWESFLNCFTHAELALFQAKDVTTVMFNDRDLEGTTSEVVTKDRFWLPSGNYDPEHPTIQYEDTIISADPGYDLSDLVTLQQKVKNGQAAGWKNLIPIPVWSGMYSFLRSAEYDDPEDAVTADRGFGTSISAVNYENNVMACGYLSLPDSLFAAMAKAGSGTGAFQSKVIAGYYNLGSRDANASVPSWGIYLKEIALESLEGSLEYYGTTNTLTFKSDSALPRNVYLTVQAYKAWDTDKTPTENAAKEETVYVADTKIETDGLTSVTFTSAVDLQDHTVQIWVEEMADNDSLAQVSLPLTFRIDGSGTASAVTETSSGNPRVFAYRSDLACSWGAYEGENGFTLLTKGDNTHGSNYGVYTGANATWQKLYVGTGMDNSPIEWWIVSRDDSDGLLLYQASANAGDSNSFGGSGSQFTKKFNASNDTYQGTVKNPSLALSGDFSFDALENFQSCVTLKVDKDAQEELEAPADSLSLQFCPTNGPEWTDAPSGGGEYYVRAAFAGATIDTVKYAPCYSNVATISVPYSVTVSNGEGGGMYFAGAAVTITAGEPAEGERFKAWTGADGLTFTSGSATTATATFTMPAQAVTVTATYETIPSFTVTFDADGGSPVPAAQTVQEGGYAVRPADDPRKAGYSFDDWYHADRPEKFDFTTYAITADTRVVALWNGVGSGGEATVIEPTYEPTVTATDHGAVAVSPASARKGETVTLAPTPQAGYEVDTVAVTDKEGKAVEIARGEDGAYTFVQPAGAVIVTVTFRPTEPVARFEDYPDLDPDAWYAPYIRWALERGVMVGDGKFFHPTQEASRAEILQILYNLSGAKAQGDLPAFKDVRAEDWYADAVTWAVSNGIAQGEGTSFGAEDPVSREQLAVMLYNFAKYRGCDLTAAGDLSRFADAGQVSPWARETMAWAVGVGLFQGTGNGNLSPLGTADRAQVAALMERLCEKVF